MCPSGSQKTPEMPFKVNAGQNHGIDPECLSMPIISNQCRSIPINSSQAELIDIGINARILIGIDQHWTLIEGVLPSASIELFTIRSLLQCFMIPSLVYVENAKISVYVETPHLFNTFFSESVCIRCS